MGPDRLSCPRLSYKIEHKQCVRFVPAFFSLGMLETLQIA